MTAPVDVLPRLARADDLAAELHDACDDARRWDYDPPSPAALEKASRLLDALAVLPPEVSIEVGVAVDGGIEMIAVARDLYYVLDISRSGRGPDVVVQQLSTRAIESLGREWLSQRHYGAD